MSNKIPTVNLPMHTIRLMEALEAKKPTLRSKPAPASDSTPSESSSEARRTSVGTVASSTTSASTPVNTDSAAHAVRDATETVTIAYGAVEAPIVQLKSVSLAMLQHFAPGVLQYKVLIDSEPYVMLPDEMDLVTARGLRYVTWSMRKALEKGCYRSTWWTKDASDKRRYVVRPRQYSPEDMIHGLYTLRAFEMHEDASFLARAETGPIVKCTKEWAENATPVELRQFLKRMEGMVEKEDSYLLDGAWKVYKAMASS